MTQNNFCRRLRINGAFYFLLALAAAGLLTSCSTAPSSSAGNNAFKFWVLRYKPPVDAASWVPNAALSADPEGAALNIAAAMRQGDLQTWLANWDASERPNLTSAQIQTMQRDWQPLQAAQFSILGRVVAEADIIVELSIGDPANKGAKIQIPLKRSKERWWLTAMDPASEYLHWENSPNKLIDYIDPDAFQKHMNVIGGARPKAKASAAPAASSTPLAGL